MKMIFNTYHLGGVDNVFIGEVGKISITLFQGKKK